jgi:uncharacterized protein (TIGR02444 family)
VYARDGVEQACLGLQAACGADVNLLLFCCWMGSRRRLLDTRFLRRAMAAVSRWQSEVVQPLRRARRALKTDGVGGPGAWRAHLRANVATLELDAEYVEQLVLARLAAQASRPVGNAGAEETIDANLERYLTLLGARSGVVSRRRLRILRAACAPRGI